MTSENNKSDIQHEQEEPPIFKMLFLSAVIGGSLWEIIRQWF
ncbi:hypothetical protein FDI90_gp155 [Pseudomonas phage PA7]|uniref:PHIKZ210.1 n=3 Tax=Phikzvirus TaxID=680115 RepID=L7SZ26_BPDPK|nr:hypothetical protein FDI90_gp155 [Pseudomonas phage PA7]YP_009639925.1 PHIKZ210.1 [Pseudomonas phage phiKZ]ANM45011.1 hypothetical protein KTN4_253 [Pseudomonas phage KTN4]WNV49843.1 hypothetical protein [Pseudomonas phage ANB1]WNV50245.1 hypothetical protein [Pseudomonas phage PhiPizzaParty]AFO70962.1 hypothetical protein [Pseudomonas phage PA7]AGC26344.1 PHIKZ210.1 [Pseudomonas phage phiKZ]